MHQFKIFCLYIMCFKTGTYYIPADCSEHSDTPSLKSENHYTLLLRKIKKEGAVRKVPKMQKRQDFQQALAFLHLKSY